jgi:Glycosyl transferase family 2
LGAVAEASVRRSNTALIAGVFLLVMSVYTIAGPGRIDMIDGQYRFEVAHNILASGSTEIYDKALPAMPATADGRHYSPYSLSSSLVSVPLVWLARATGDSLEREHFLFSLTSGLFGAATAALLLLFYLALRVSPRRAVMWTLVFAFATSMLPASTTVFDQANQGFFLLAACFLLFGAVRRDSLGLAAAAGLMMAVVVNLKEVYAALVPAVAVIAVAEPGVDAALRRRSFIRAGTFVAVTVAGVLVVAGLNYLRFRGPLSSLAFADTGLSLVGNPLLGLAGLLISPGKGVVAYSAATVLGVWGLRRLLGRELRLAQGVIAASVIHLLGMSMLTFFAGDWCWGPRYLVPITPLVALGFPLVDSSTRSRRRWLSAIVGLSLAVQLAGISIDHHRFFYARSLMPFFWYGDPGFYFRESALLARPGEILESIRHGVPAEATAFRPGPHPELLTYAVFGTAGNNPPMPIWMRAYRVFWDPRPWPLWLRHVAPGRRPIDIGRWLGMAFAGAGVGVLLLGIGLRRRPDEAIGWRDWTDVGEASTLLLSSRRVRASDAIEPAQRELSVVIPCLNEATTIAACVTTAIETMRAHGIDGEVVVSDNGSQDGSIEIATAAGARVVSCPTRGYGAALQYGFYHAVGRFVLMADADESYDFGLIPQFIEKARSGAQFVIGSRLRGRIDPGAMPFLHRFLGTPVLTWILNCLFDTRISDCNCGMRCIERVTFFRLGVVSPGMEFASEMIVKAAVHDVEITEVPIDFHKDQRNRRPHLRPFHDGWRHLRLLLWHAPDHMMSVPGLVLLVVGLFLVSSQLTGPISMAGASLDIHYMILGITMSLIGTSAISLGLVVGATMPAGRVRHLRMLQNAHRWYTFDTAARISAVLLVFGLILDGFVLGYWLYHHGGELTPAFTRLTLFGLLLIAMAAQIAFSALLLGITFTAAPTGQPQPSAARRPAASSVPRVADVLIVDDRADAIADVKGRS